MPEGSFLYFHSQPNYIDSFSYLQKIHKNLSKTFSNFTITKTEHKFENILTYTNICSILILSETQENLSKYSQTVLAAPRIIDRFSHTYTQIQCRNGRNLNSGIAIVII